jgi:predicted transposase YdaD
LAIALSAQARQRLTDAGVQQDLINRIETIIIYKLPHQKIREKIAAKLSLSKLKPTRFY